MKTLPSLLAVSLSVALSAGCARQKKPEPGYEADISQATAFFTPGPPAGSSAALDPKEVLFTVDGKPVTRGELVSETIRLASALGLPPERVAQEKERLLAEAEKALVARALLNQAAEKENVSIPVSDITGQIEKVTSSLPAGTTLEDFLKKQNTSLDQVTDNIRANLRLERVLEKHSQGAAAPTEEEVAAFFKENTKAFARPETMMGQHIVKMAPATGNKEAALKAVIDEMEALRLKAMDEKTDFDLLAREHTQQRGRDGKPQTHAAFPRGATPPIFEKEIFKLSPGQVSEVLVLENQVHLFKCAELSPAQVPDLEKARPQIVEVLTRRQKEKRIEAYVGELRAKAKIERLAPVSGQKETPADGNASGKPAGADPAANGGK